MNILTDKQTELAKRVAVARRALNVNEETLMQVGSDEIQRIVVDLAIITGWKNTKTLIALLLKEWSEKEATLDALHNAYIMWEDYFKITEDNNVDGK